MDPRDVGTSPPRLRVSGDGLSEGTRLGPLSPVEGGGGGGPCTRAVIIKVLRGWLHQKRMLSCRCVANSQRRIALESFLIAGW